VASHERWLRKVRPTLASTLRDDPDCPVCTDGRLLALELLLAGRLECHSSRSRAHRRLADEDRAWLGDGLQARGRVDEIAGDHTLVRCPDRDGGLTGEDARPRTDLWARGSDPVHDREGPP